MIRMILTLGAVLTAVPAVAGDPFDGRWGIDEGACAAEPGTTDVVASVIKDRSVDHYESTCEISGVTPIGTQSSSAWRVTMTCSGEGETWGEDAILAVDQGEGRGHRQLIEIDMETGLVIVRRSCD